MSVQDMDHIEAKIVSHLETRVRSHDDIGAARVLLEHLRSQRTINISELLARETAKLKE